jgi:hypothetical protein
MTLALADCGRSDGGANGAPKLSPAASAWEAIEAMEQARTDRISLDGGGMLTRAKIFDTLGAS